MPSHRRYHLLGNLLHFHCFSSETNGRYCLVEVLVAPQAGVPLNSHPGEEEVFVILEGRFEFTVGEETLSASSGDTVVIPSGAKHAFTNISDAPGRLTVFNAPGNVHDIFFTQAGDPVPEDSWNFPQPGTAPDLPHILSVAEKAGMTIYPPPQT